MYLACAKKVKSILLCVLFCQGLAQASDWHISKLFGSAPDNIIAPYEPSFMVCHPEVCAGCGVVTACLAALPCINEPIVWAALSFLIIKGAGHWLNKPYKTIDLLLVDPVKLHAQSIQILKENFENKKTLFKQNPLEWIQLVKKYEEENPIFLLDECDTAFCSDKYKTGIDNVFICVMSCLLSRSLNPQYRATFENCIVKKVLSKQKTNKKPFWWVSFGCGDLLQDLVTLVKLFTKNPTLSMRLHLIDLLFFELMMVFDFIKSEGSFHTGYYDTAQYSDDLIVHDSAMLRSCFAFIVQKYPVYCTDKKNNENTFKVKVYQQYAVLKQFTFFLQKTFPRVDLSVSIHNNVDTYLSFQDQKEGAPHLVTAVDIEDAASVENEGPLNYAKLCVEVLKINPFLNNLWLAKKNYRAASLRTIALDGKEEDKVENEQLGVACYITEEML